jgi:hypothetical protein
MATARAARDAVGAAAGGCADIADGSCGMPLLPLWGAYAHPRRTDRPALAPPRGASPTDGASAVAVASSPATLAINDTMRNRISRVSSEVLQAIVGIGSGRIMPTDLRDIINIFSIKITTIGGSAFMLRVADAAPASMHARMLEEKDLILLVWTVYADYVSNPVYLQSCAVF